MTQFKSGTVDMMEDQISRDEYLPLSAKVRYFGKPILVVDFDLVNEMLVMRDYS